MPIFHTFRLFFPSSRQYPQSVAHHRLLSWLSAVSSGFIKGSIGTVIRNLLVVLLIRSQMLYYFHYVLVKRGEINLNIGDYFSNNIVRCAGEREVGHEKSPPAPLVDSVFSATHSGPCSIKAGCRSPFYKNHPIIA